MRLVTIEHEGAPRAGEQQGDRVRLLPYPDVGAALRAAAAGENLQRQAGDAVPVAGVRLLPVVPSPGKIIGLGLNFHSHLRELGREPPEYPSLFAKFPGSLVGARDPIVLPPESARMDWEAEPAVVLGGWVRRASLGEAEQAIAGYTVMNDVTARDWQTRTRQFLQGKTFEATSPLGPALVTREEIGVLEDLVLRCQVDAITVQEEKLSDMVWSPAELVAYASTIITLEPGDVIALGTPAGVGRNQEPPMFLRAGQVVRTSIDGIGELVNRCVADPAAPGPGLEARS